MNSGCGFNRDNRRCGSREIEMGISGVFELDGMGAGMFKALFPCLFLPFSRRTQGIYYLPSLTGAYSIYIMIRVSSAPYLRCSLSLSSSSAKAIVSGVRAPWSQRDACSALDPCA